MENDDFMLLQCEEIEGDFDLGDLKVELENIETDEDLRANEDQINIVDQDQFLQNQMQYRADNTYLHPHISIPLVKLLFSKDLAEISKIYH